jgi:hypothetical protein
MTHHFRQRFIGSTVPLSKTQRHRSSPMRYATALVAALVLGASASLYTPSAKAGVVVGIGLPVPIVVPRVAYYPYSPGPAIELGFAPAFYGAGVMGPRFRDHRYFSPGYVHGGYFRGGYRR